MQNKMHKTMNYTKMKTNVPIISMLLITNSCPHGPYLYIHKHVFLSRKRSNKPSRLLQSMLILRKKKFLILHNLCAHFEKRERISWFVYIVTRTHCHYKPGMIADTCLMVSEGSVTEWPIVLESSYISWSFPPWNVKNTVTDQFIDG